MEEKIKKILQVLQTNCQIDENFTNRNIFLKVIKPFRDNYPDGAFIDWDTGASKLVLISKKDGFVIKIPFTGAEDDDYGYDPFIGADAENGWDYCESEVNIYEMAAEYKVQDCFAKIECIGTVNGHPIYIQEYAEMLTCTTETPSYSLNSKEKVENYCEENNFECFNSTWLSCLMEQIGNDAFENFANFIEYWGISDLHSGNLGYIHNKPVLIDFGGFNE